MKKHLKSLLALLLLACLPLSAAAHPVPDEQKDGHCSITVTMTYQGKALPGGTLALYKVGDVAEEDGNYSFVPVEAIREDMAQFGDIQSPELAEKLHKLESKLTPVTALPQKVGEDGKVTFSSLPFGLYLAVQKTAHHQPHHKTRLLLRREAAPDRPAVVAGAGAGLRRAGLHCGGAVPPQEGRG